MNTNRPHIKIPHEAIDIIIDVTAITLLVLIWVYCIINFKELPDTIATHFNGTGEPNGYGSKYTIWIIPTIATVTFIGLFILNRYPHKHNYMINITETNALKKYRLSTKIVRIVNFLCVLLIAYITYMMVESAFGKQFSLGTWFVPLVIGFSIIIPIAIIIYMKKLNK